MTEAQNERSKHQIQALHMATEIIETLQEHGEMGVSALAARLDIPKSTAHAYLDTLNSNGWVVNNDGQYRLSLRFLEIGGKTRQSMRVFQAIRPHIDELSMEVGEVANLGIEEKGKRVLLYTSEPSEGVFDNAPSGQFAHMNWTALGKALLAQLSDERVDEIIDRHGLPMATEHTITDPEELYTELEQIRQQGYSVEDEEHREGIKAIAVMLQYEDEPSPVAAISISGPKRRISKKDTEQLIDSIRNTVNVIELEYKYY
ncbi:IclR family transcriptional regulator [Haloarcula halophila]|uniref:IclR family transcriptional regulator n=1 Tax=Haloarcula TaxID=2237 RepID=UPI0023E377D8|nr:IclR family transcriptional regulator [Halomicroarcula sp. DFY41]